MHVADVGYIIWRIVRTSKYPGEWIARRYTTRNLSFYFSASASLFIPREKSTQAPSSLPRETKLKKLRHGDVETNGGRNGREDGGETTRKSRRDRVTGWRVLTSLYLHIYRYTYYWEGERWGHVYSIRSLCTLHPPRHHLIIATYSERAVIINRSF